jgi:hypothetical protein
MAVSVTAVVNQQNSLGVLRFGLEQGRIHLALRRSPMVRASFVVTDNFDGQAAVASLDVGWKSEDFDWQCAQKRKDKKRAPCAE